MLPLRPTAVALALAALSAAQVTAAVRLPVPIEQVELQATKENYGFFTEGRQMTVSFQLRNAGARAVRITDIGAALPGLDLVDVTASGEPFAFRSRGEGSEPLPVFDLPPEGIAVLSLTYRLAACGQVPSDARPVPVQVRDGRARGTVSVPLPPLPDDGAQATAEDVLEWQAVLVRDLCA